MRSLILLSCLCGVSLQGLAAPVAYTIDPAHTEVRFSWNHLQYSNPGASFDEIGGVLMWDADDIGRTSIRVTMAIDSVHSHVAALDAKLKSAEFLDAAKYPTATFASTHVERLDDHGHLRVSGNLTVHGVTRPVDLDAHLNQVGVYPMLNVPAAGFDASAVIKRSEFGVGGGVPYVGDELHVRITTEALEAAGYAKAMKTLAEATAAK